MILENLKPACGSTKALKEKVEVKEAVTVKLLEKVIKVKKARSGYNVKRGFEGGQQPLARRLPKVGFVSRVVKPYTINVEKVTAIAELPEITVESIRSVYKLSKTVVKVKLIGATAKNLSAKIKDENVTTTGK